MRRLIILSLSIICTASLFAQTAGDVVRYSYLQQGGSARYLGAGGAFGALGAEFGTVSSNPAGLAMFRTDELVLTPSIRFSKVDADLEGNGNTTWPKRKSVFNFDNVGLVFNTTPAKGHWKTVNMGIGMNRLNNYNQSVYYKGTANGTIMNGFYEEARSVFANGGTSEDLYPFGAQMAWNADAIYTDADGNLFYDFLDNPNAAVDRVHKVNLSGRMNELAMAFAGNYDEKLMVGVTVGVPIVNYRQDGTYDESNPSAVEGLFDNLRYTEYISTDGIGVNLKLGLIYKVSPAIRLGASVHTPTRIAMTDTYNNSFQYTYRDPSDLSILYTSDIQDSGNGVTDYRLRTPWRAIGSAAFVIKKSGFISADVEYVDYTTNQYNLTANSSDPQLESDERAVNDEITLQYRQTANIRVGGELAVNKFRFRAGVNLLGNPYSDTDANGDPVADYNNYNMAYTAGVGVRGESFYIDLGYRRYNGHGSVSAYAGAPVASTDVSNNDLLLTLGFKF